MNKRLDFDAFLTRILVGYYDQTGIAQFRIDLLNNYGWEHEEIFQKLSSEHDDLFGLQRLEEILGSFVKLI